MTAVQLYTDLLIKALANTIYCDPALVPGQHTKRPFDFAVRYEGKDWPASAHTMVGIKRLENLRDLVQRVLDEGIPGHLIETGVWRGGCCILMRGVLAANEINDRKVYVADSFEGLPKPRVGQDEGTSFINTRSYRFRKRRCVTTSNVMACSMIRSPLFRVFFKTLYLS